MECRDQHHVAHARWSTSPPTPSNDTSVFRHQLAIESERTVPHRNIDMAEGIAVAAGIRVWPSREHEVAPKRPAVIAVGLALVDEVQRAPVGCFTEAPSEV